MAMISDRSTIENKENLTLIWFDPHIDVTGDREITIKTLRGMNDYVLVYTDTNQCISYIQSIRNEKIFLVISGMWASILLPSIIDLKPLEAVFIFCGKSEEYLHLMEKYSKIVGVFIDQRELGLNLRKKLHSFNKQSETFSFYDQNQKVSINLSEQTAQFLWFQLFRDVILHLPSDKSAKQQMINVCRQYYQNSDRELAQINEFERTYTKSDCIHWYTRETFVYKMVNKALRTEDVQQLHTFRFYINDLSSKLAKEAKSREREDDEQISTKIYRGAQFLPSELEQFQSNEGKLISMNGYLSASRLQCVAESFAMNEPRRLNSLPVLFEIECFHGEDQCSIFADISRFSKMPEEQEVLFDIGAVFKIERICPDEQMWKISLTATDDGREITREYIEEIKKEMHGESVRILFGSLLTRMGRYDRAETYFYRLLKDPGEENLAQIYNQLGLVYHAKAQFIPAIEYFHLAYELIDPSHRDSAVVLRNISAVLIEQGYHKKALEHSKKAMKVLEELNEECPLEMAHCLQSIGLSYFGLRMYAESLEFSERALNIKRNCLPENHVHIAESFNFIGMIYLMTKDFERAFTYYQLSLEMYQICLPDDHPTIANVFHNIGDYFFHKNQHDQAVQYYHLAWIMKKKSLPFDHPSRAMTLNSLSTVYSFKGDKDKALDLCLQALNIREKILPSDHLDLAMSYSSAGHKYEAINEHRLALTYFEKALNIREKFLSTNDPVRKRAERHVVRMKRKLM